VNEKRNNMNAKERFYELRNQRRLINTEELDEVFNALEPVACESILGKWKGGDFNTGHKGSTQLREMKWYGKTFNSFKDAKPLICYNERGELYSNQELGGEASLWMIEFRGKVSATMVYDSIPVFDHFRKVNENTLMGIMNGKDMVFDNGKHYYFFLERI
jgi:hypothetical protein